MLRRKAESSGLEAWRARTASDAQLNAYINAASRARVLNLWVGRVRVVKYTLPNSGRLVAADFHFGDVDVDSFLNRITPILTSALDIIKVYFPLFKHVNVYLTANHHQYVSTSKALFGSTRDMVERLANLWGAEGMAGSLEAFPDTAEFLIKVLL